MSCIGATDRQLPTFFGLFGPARMPEAVLNRLNREIDSSLRHASVQSKMVPLGAIPGGPSAQEFAAEVREGYHLVGGIVKALGIAPK